MREIRPYGSEGGGGETLPTPISSRWLSEATPSGYEMGVKAAGTPVGVQDLMPRCRPVVSSRMLLNHRLMAAMPPASSRSKSVINGREEYKQALGTHFWPDFPSHCLRTCLEPF